MSKNETLGSRTGPAWRLTAPLRSLSRLGTGLTNEKTSSWASFPRLPITKRASGQLRTAHVYYVFVHSYCGADCSEGSPWMTQWGWLLCVDETPHTLHHSKDHPV